MAGHFHYGYHNVIGMRIYCFSTSWMKKEKFFFTFPHKWDLSVFSYKFFRSVMFRWSMMACLEFLLKILCPKQAIVGCSTHLRRYAQERKSGIPGNSWIPTYLVSCPSFFQISISLIFWIFIAHYFQILWHWWWVWAPSVSASAWHTGLLVDLYIWSTVEEIVEPSSCMLWNCFLSNMGVKGLLQCLQKATQASSIAGFKGTRVAIDASGWLHKGLYAAAEDFVNSGDTCRHPNVLLCTTAYSATASEYKFSRTLLFEFDDNNAIFYLTRFQWLPILRRFYTLSSTQLTRSRSWACSRIWRKKKQFEGMTDKKSTKGRTQLFIFEHPMCCTISGINTITEITSWIPYFLDEIISHICSWNWPSSPTQLLLFPSPTSSVHLLIDAIPYFSHCIILSYSIWSSLSVSF